MPSRLSQVRKWSTSSWHSLYRFPSGADQMYHSRASGPRMRRLSNHTLTRSLRMCQSWVLAPLPKMAA